MCIYCYRTKVVPRLPGLLARHVAEYMSFAVSEVWRKTTFFNWHWYHDWDGWKRQEIEDADATDQETGINFGG